jgi:hypothetical protein
MRRPLLAKIKTLNTCAMHGGTTALHPGATSPRVASSLHSASISSSYCHRVSLQMLLVSMPVLDSKDRAHCILYRPWMIRRCCVPALKRDSAITHDKRCFSPLSYVFEKYILSKHGNSDLLSFGASVISAVMVARQPCMHAAAAGSACILESCLAHCGYQSS